MMLTTEEEAKTKQCRVIPAVYVPTPVHQNGRSTLMAVDQGGPIQFNVGYGQCVASKCMQWRWRCDDGQTRVGYCGAAGRPMEFIPAR